VQDVLRLAVQPQQIEQVKQRQHDNATTKNMFNSQATDELITPALGFFVLV